MRGTTPTIEFKLPFDSELIEVAYLTIAQNGVTRIEKAFDTWNCSGQEVRVRLSQEETTKLKQSPDAIEMQVRIRTKSGDAIKSNIAMESAGRLLKDGVI